MKKTISLTKIKEQYSLESIRLLKENVLVGKSNENSFYIFVGPNFHIPSIIIKEDSIEIIHLNNVKVKKVIPKIFPNTSILPGNECAFSINGSIIRFLHNADIIYFKENNIEEITTENDVMTLSNYLGGV